MSQTRHQKLYTGLPWNLDHIEIMYCMKTRIDQNFTRRGSWQRRKWSNSKRVWKGGGYNCQLSVKILTICQLSVKWLLMINYETYLNIFDAKLRYIQCKLDVKFENWCNSALIFISFAIVSISSGLHSSGFVGQSPTFPTIKPINIVYLPTRTHYAWELWTKDIDLTHEEQFLMPDSQIQTNCPLTHDE